MYFVGRCVGSVFSLLVEIQNVIPTLLAKCSTGNLATVVDVLFDTVILFVSLVYRLVITITKLLPQSN